MEQLKQYLTDTNKKTFLDIGTGAGNFIHFIKDLYNGYESIIGIDLHDRSLEIAKQHNTDEKVTFEKMDAYEMSFPDKTFDVVMLSNSLHHLKNISGLLLEMKRVLKDNGFIIINEMIADQLNNMQISHKMLHHFAAEIDRLHGETHNDTFTEEEIISKLTEDQVLTTDLSWHLNVPSRTENTKEEMEYIMSILNRIETRFPEEKKMALKKKKDHIQKYIEENGYDGCTSLISILKK